MRGGNATASPAFEALEDRAVPATFVVSNLSDAGAGSLRQAIIDANGAAGADTVDFQLGAGGAINLFAGELAITDDLTLDAQPAEAVAISAQGMSRVLRIDGVAAPTVTIRGLTIRDGNDNFGGGIFLQGGNLTLEHTIVVQNQSTYEGAGLLVGLYAATVDVVGSTFDGNVAGGAGGGMFAATSNGTVTVRDSTFSNNTADSGGGIAIGGNFTAFVLENSTVTGNATMGAEGGFGGGVYGALYSGGTLTIRNSTIAGNTAVFGGGGVGLGLGGGTIILESTIVADNAAPSGNDVRGMVDSTASLIEDPFGATINDLGGTIMGFDPFLGPLANNGGPTRTRLPGLNSLAIDAGFNPAALPFDQRGLPRLFGAGVDVGAVEINPNPSVTPPQPLSVPNVHANSAPDRYEFAVEFADLASLNAALSAGAFEVVGPGGFVAAATLVSSSAAGPFTAVYSIVPPGGAWDAADTGPYAISYLDGANRAPPFPVAGFFVDLVPPLATTIAAPNVDAASVPDAYVFSIAFADDGEVDPASIVPGLINVICPGNIVGAAELVALEDPGPGQPKLAAYRFLPPGGRWVFADNGEYLIELADGLLRDLAGNVAPGGVIGGWLVNVPVAGAGNVAGWFDIARGAGTANPADTPEQAYVRKLYASVLGREPDQAGFDGWVAELQRGRSRAEVAKAFLASEQYRGLAIEQLYQGILGRSADATGLAGYQARLAGGASLEELAAELLGSAEYRAKHVSNADFVAGVFRDVLDRAPDAAAQAGYVQALDAGASRTAVALSVLRSEESRQLTWRKLGLAYLGAVPDAGPGPGGTLELAASVLASSAFSA